MKLFVATISLALSVTVNAEEAKSIKYTAGASQIIITDLGLIPGGTTSSGLAINNQPVIVGLANDSNFALQRPFLGRKHRSDNRLRGQLQSSQHRDSGAHE